MTPTHLTALAACRLHDSARLLDHQGERRSGTLDRIRGDVCFHQLLSANDVRAAA